MIGASTVEDDKEGAEGSVGEIGRDESSFGVVDFDVEERLLDEGILTRFPSLCAA